MSSKRTENETEHLAYDADDYAQSIARHAYTMAATMERTEAGVRALQGEVYGLLEQIEPAGPPLACGVGCSSCCSQRVAVMPYEAALAYLDAPLQRLEQVRRASKNSSSGAQRGPCPLLEDRLCTIYSARPGACRTEHSFSREACERGPGHRHPYDGRRELVSFALLRGEVSGLHAQGLDVHVVELVEALNYLTCQYGPRRAQPLQDWLAGQRIFPRALNRSARQQRRKSVLVQLRLDRSKEQSR